jgi:hypothetical protein
MQIQLNYLKLFSCSISIGNWLCCSQARFQSSFLHNLSRRLLGGAHATTSRGGHRFGSVRFRSQTTEPDEPTVQISRPISNQLNVRFSRFSGSPVRSVTVRFSRFGSYIKFFGRIQLLFVTF